ncbi:hypothetical protein [Nocardia cyriacigeorgica]|uniref:hypothetical protein n=1 Tax=Nocardia cyriacigeorgica TaxID=135487 RepID=UPI0018937C59|nr:hypothetical protein [Nocardia cyriacigeorgica]MBF6439054.1 hypothetical protein [Nocardia cyriacigeorgica]
MRSVTVASAVIGVYAVVASFAFATTAVETMLLYPNIFREVPDSLAQTEEFMSVVAVGDVMRPMGGVLTLTALIACAVAVRYRMGRAWMTASLISLISGQFLLSVLYQWPRASILFDDRDEHTLAEIEQAASEFLLGQGVRIAAAGVTAVCAVVAALVCYRARVLETAADEFAAAL